VGPERFNQGGFIKTGKVYVAPVGTRFLTSDHWTELGEVEGDGIKLPADGDAFTITATNRTITATLAPPRTRREKRERNAFYQLVFGELPRPRVKRQLIHNGRKP
jgi:hypothetical protein